MNRCRLCLALVAYGVAAAAHAHSTSTNFLVIRVEKEDVHIVWDIAVADLHWAIGLDADADRRITWAEIEARQAAITSLALRELAVSRGETTCLIAARDVMLATHAGEPHVSVNFSGRCPAAGRFAITSSLLFAQDTAQRTLTEVSTESGRFTSLLSQDGPRWVEPQSPAWTAMLAAFIGQGMWHVWIGYDHLAFLLLLLLPGVLRGNEDEWRAAESTRSVVRGLATVVTTFTLAHSVTLALAATGTMLLPARLVEIAIAASIIAAGLLNLSPRAARWRAPLAFGFGLVHGFGFANALAELGPTGAPAVPALAGFNLGVELGQLAIVALALPALLRLRDSRFYAARLMPAASLLATALGALWLVQRWPQ